MKDFLVTTVVTEIVKCYYFRSKFSAHCPCYV